MKQIPIGTIVTIEAPGGRGDNGNTRTIPALVLSQWPDGSALRLVWSRSLKPMPTCRTNWPEGLTSSSRLDVTRAGRPAQHTWFTNRFPSGRYTPSR